MSYLGIHGDGTAVELTHHLAPLRDENVGPLAELAKSGIGFDGITLTLAQAQAASQTKGP